MVSVIIPNYNHARYLPKRIESVLNQVYTDFEVLILDDCSPDNSREVIDQYAASDSRIRVLYNDKNSGSTFRQWNKGISQTTGDYVWLAESDDYAHPQFLEKLVALLDANPTVGLAYCDSISVDEHSNELHEWKHGFCDYLQTNLWMSDFTMSGIDFARRFMSYSNVIPNASATLLRRSVLQRIGPADEHTRLTGDWLYWIALLSQADVSYTHQAYNYFRTHTNNVRSKTMLNGILLEETSRVLLKIRKVLGDTHENQVATQRLFERWLNDFVYAEIPISRNVALWRNMSQLMGGKRLMNKWKEFVFSNNLLGARLILGDGFLYKIFRKGSIQP